MRSVRTIAFVIASIMLTVFPGCSSEIEVNNRSIAAKAVQKVRPSDEKKYNIILAYSGNKETTSGRSALIFKEIMEKRSDGRVTATLYDNNQLGNEKETMEGIQLGNITMGIVATSAQVSFVPKLAVFDLPNALTDLDVVQKVLEEGDFIHEIKGAYSNANFKLLSLIPFSMRQMSSNKPVLSPKDFRGIRIRTLENKYHMAYWSALGAAPTPVAFTELYIALQHGLVDAQENPMNTIVEMKLAEQQKYVIKTKHIMFIYSYLINKEYYDALPVEYKEMLETVIKEVRSLTVERAKQAEYEAESALSTKYGIKVIGLTDDVLQQMLQAAQPVYKMVREDIGDNLVDALLNEVKAAAKK